MREAAPLRGSSASLREARNRSSIGFFLSIAIAFRRERLPANFFAILRRRLFFSIELVFAIRLSLPFPRLRGGLDPPHCRNGKLNAVSSARASSSVRAVVQTVMSIPQVAAVLS